MVLALAYIYKHWDSIAVHPHMHSAIGSARDFQSGFDPVRNAAKL